MHRIRLIGRLHTFYRVGTKLAANANTELGTFILRGWLLGFAKTPRLTTEGAGSTVTPLARCSDTSCRKLIDCRCASIFSFKLAHNSLLIHVLLSVLMASSDSAEKSTALTMSAMVIFSALRAKE